MKKMEKSINTLILTIYMFELHSENFVDILCKLTKKSGTENEKMKI